MTVSSGIVSLLKSLGAFRSNSLTVKGRPPMRSPAIDSSAPKCSLSIEPCSIFQVWPPVVGSFDTHAG